MKLIVLLLLVAVVALAIWMIVRAASSLLEDKANNKWRADFETLPDGETVVYVAKGKQEIEYASIAPVEAYEKSGKTSLERAAEIEVSLEEAEMWAERHAK